MVLFKGVTGCQGCDIVFDDFNNAIEHCKGHRDGTEELASCEILMCQKCGKWFNYDDITNAEKHEKICKGIWDIKG